ncbi:MAG: alpha/beta hydrolase, partial [Actinomycetota bacterium]
MSLTMDEHAPVQASWVETSTGIRETASFFGSASERLFGVMHTPPAAPSGGVVVCSPLYAEFARNYRREVLLGRALAERGIAVQRFHYRGSGHSDGQPGAMTFASMLGDAAVAAERLVGETGVRRVAFVATRWAALVAAAAAARYDSPLSLWQPSVD